MAARTTGSGTGLDHETKKAGERLQQEKNAASRVADDAWDSAKQAGSDAAQRAQQEAEAQGERLKEGTSSELDAFAAAIKAASDKLSERQPGMTADLMGQAAGGLHDMSEALQRRSTGEIVGAIRDFGRRNPTAFIAGSVLTGFALGRFAGSHRPAPETEPAPARGARGPAAGTRRPGASGNNTMRSGG